MVGRGIVLSEVDGVSWECECLKWGCLCRRGASDHRPQRSFVMYGLCRAMTAFYHPLHFLLLFVGSLVGPSFLLLFVHFRVSVPFAKIPLFPLIDRIELTYVLVDSIVPVLHSESCICTLLKTSRRVSYQGELPNEYQQGVLKKIYFYYYYCGLYIFFTSSPYHADKYTHVYAR